MEYHRVLYVLSITRHLSSPTRLHSFRHWYSAKNWLIPFNPLIPFSHTIQTSLYSISTLESHRSRLSIQAIGSRVNIHVKISYNIVFRQWNINRVRVVEICRLSLGTTNSYDAALTWILTITCKVKPWCGI